jgi:hypothetical protein
MAACAMHGGGQGSNNRTGGGGSKRKRGGGDEMTTKTSYECVGTGQSPSPVQIESPVIRL